MPQLFTKRIKIMTVYGYLEPLCILLGLFFAGMFLLTSFSGHSIGIRAATAGLGLSFIGIILFLDRYIKHLRQQSDLSPYRIPIHAVDYESVCAMLTATPIDTEGCISFRKRNGFSVRLLIQHCPAFLPQEVSSRRKALNKRINLRFPSPQSGPAHEVLKRLRINLVVCDSMNGDAESWVRRDAAHLLDRNESTVNTVLCLNEQILLLPAVLDSLSLPQVRKYQAAAELLIGKLVPGVDK